MKLPELVAPAGNKEKLITALHYGADAVYTGLSAFSLRARADNFTSEGLAEAARIVHQYGRKIYVTVNIFPHNRDLELINQHLRSIKSIGPDGLIVSDPGVFAMAREVIPEVPLHISTQLNITNSGAARFWERQGAKRIVLSRELTIDEIKEIRDSVSLELECFVHGAICISYSGRCYISSFLANRSANQGECTNSCRWNYTLMEEKRPGEYHPVYENDRGTYILSSRDLCMIEHLDKLHDAGINCFKIEGRMKGINYVAGVVKTYREAVDCLGMRPYRVQERWLNELCMFSSRGFTTGMFLGKQPDTDYNHDEAEVYRMSHELVGVVKSVNGSKAVIRLRNRLKIGDRIEFLSPGIEQGLHIISEMYDDEGNALTYANNEDTVIITVENGIQPNDLIRRLLS